MKDKQQSNQGRGRRGDAGAPRRDGKPARAGRDRRSEMAAEKPRAEKSYGGERIAKVMARAGLCSRRDAEQWIAQGRVAVNGRALTSPAFNVRESDHVEVDGKPLEKRERTRLFLFHKPAGLVTSAKDPQGRETVFGYLQKRHPALPRVVSVGRLDINTEGLLLLTNDGGLARTLELPATGWTRRYRVRAHGEVEQSKLDELRKGVVIDGVAYAPIEAVLDRARGANAWITMALREGKNREIKRVLEHLGLDVTRLIRVSFGPFQLGELGEGEVREVRREVLREQLGKSLSELAGVDFSSPLKERREISPAEAEEARKRAQTRTRKHVSALRAEREAGREKGPRSRIERGATSDHKGHSVAVERIVAARPKLEPKNRNARRFEAERQAVETRTPGRPRSRSRFGAEAEFAPRAHAKERDEERGRFRRASRAPAQARAAPSDAPRRGRHGEHEERPRNFERHDRSPRAPSRKGSESQHGERRSFGDDQRRSHERPDAPRGHASGGAGKPNRPRKPRRPR